MMKVNVPASLVRSEPAIVNVVASLAVLAREQPRPDGAFEQFIRGVWPLCEIHKAEKFWMIYPTGNLKDAPMVHVQL